MESRYVFDVVSQLRKEIEDLVRFLPQIVHERPAAFDNEFHSRLEKINNLSLLCPEDRSEVMKYFFDLSGNELEKGRINQRSRRKPLGYAGDYLVIDWTHTQKADSQGVGALWDQFYHRLAAPIAVRNRKKYFCDLFAALCTERPNNISVLNVASGPCRDVAEAITQAGPHAAGSLFHCVDVEKDAIAYALETVQPHCSAVTFHWEIVNVFKFRPTRQYDLVWSGGLFDYLEDGAAVNVLKKLWSATALGGKLVVGNFHPSNPSRNIMEWGSNWFLIYRTEDDMLRVFERAGVPPELVSVDQDPSGACVFGIATRAS
jgi:extracellular factor (EF) 3-hydroxypalmitic acid methyl ester biosynthesis protein